jgi:hypothetical protein
MGLEEPEQVALAPDSGATSTRSHCPLFPEELIACIADGREPTTSELISVASRISAEARAETASSWVLYAAHLALTGDCGLTECLIEVAELHAEPDHAVRGSITPWLIVR